MKTLLMGLLLSLSAFAANESNLSLITKGQYQVVVKAPHCPVGAMCGPTSMLNLSLPLNGCLDTAVVSYKIIRDAGKTKVMISALNVANKASLTARCIVAPTAQKSIMLGSGVLTKESVQIEFLTSLAE